MNNNAYIYKYIVNGQDRYIGKGRGNRARMHLSDKSRATPWARFLQKSVESGAEVEVVIIANDLSDIEADALEVKLIAEIGRKVLGTGPLMNVRDGGDSVTSADAKRAAAKRNANPAHIEKQRQNSKKQMQDPKQIEVRSRNVKCVETGEVFASIKEANESKGIKGNGVAKVLSPKAPHKTAGGFHWEYA